MRENQLLQHIYQRSGAAPALPHVVVGPGDDCAAIDLGPTPTLVTTDQLIAGRHFDPDSPAERIAHKALARAVSDIAAMAGEPRAAVVAAALPPGFDAAAQLVDSLNAVADRLDCPIVGGDISTTTAVGPLALTVTVLGSPHDARGPVLRSTAHAGDALFVTGRLGGAWRSDRAHDARQYHFLPRVREARELADALGPDLTAMIDLSDGLGVDSARLAEASRLRIEIDAATVPAHQDARDTNASLGDGEDYELAFTVRDAARHEQAIRSLAERWRLPITRVGDVRPGAGAVVRTPDGAAIDATTLGWQHE